PLDSVVNLAPASSGPGPVNLRFHDPDPLGPGSHCTCFHKVFHFTSFSDGLILTAVSRSIRASSSSPVISYALLRFRKAEASLLSSLMAWVKSSIALGTSLIDR